MNTEMKVLTTSSSLTLGNSSELDCARSIMTFEHEQWGTVRCWKSQEGKVMFLASDVAKGLGYRDAYTMTRSLDDDEKDTQIVCTPGGNQEMTVITQSGFFHAALKSRVEKAKKFRRWVTDVVLPQIMSTGGYIPVSAEDDEKTILAKAVGIMKRTIEQKDALLEAQKPKVMFAEAVTAQDDSILIRDLAKLITQNGVNIGQGRLFYWLRLHGYLFQRETRPIQKWVEEGLFETNITLIHTFHGTKECCTTKVTGKGQAYFVNGFLTGRFKAVNGDFR